MHKLVTLNSLRQDMATYIAKIKKGESFVVYKRSEPLFCVSPVKQDVWEEVIDFTKIKKGGVNLQDILSRL